MLFRSIRNWNAFSNSSPIEGIVEAIRTYYSKDKKISIYVFGDEFTGSSIDAVVKSVDVLNRADNAGERRVRIHAIGFPVRPDAPQYTSIRFATLMRILCAKNGGSFVGLHDPERRGPQFRIGDASAAPSVDTAVHDSTTVRPALQSRPDGDDKDRAAGVSGHATGQASGEEIDLVTSSAHPSLAAPPTPRPS